VSLSNCFRVLFRIDFNVGWFCAFVETLLVSSTDCTGCTLSGKPLGDRGESFKGPASSGSQEGFSVFVTGGWLETLCVSNTS
jgi:hypothetical protein